MAAVAEDVSALKYASDKLRNDRDFVSNVVAQNGAGPALALNYAPLEPRSDMAFLSGVLEQNNLASLYEISPSLVAVETGNGLDDVSKISGKSSPASSRILQRGWSAVKQEATQTCRRKILVFGHLKEAGHKL